MPDHILAIDQGTQSSRAIVFDNKWNVVATAQQAVSLTRPRENWVEQDAAELIGAVKNVIRQVLAQVDTRRIAAAGLATQRSSVLAWEVDSLKPLSPVLSWQDVRGNSYLTQLENRSIEEIQRESGLPLSPHYGASKLRWLLDHNPSVQDAARRNRLRFGPLAAFVVDSLVDEHQRGYVDHVNGFRTQLMSLDSLEWSPLLLKLFNIPVQWLPQPRPTQFAYGNLVAVTQQANIPLVAVNGDQNAALHAVSQQTPHEAIVNLGSGAFICLPTGQRPIRVDRLLCGLANSWETERSYLVEGTVNGAGSAIAWADDQLPFNQNRQHHSDPNNMDWQSLLLSGPNLPLFVNSVGGIGSPWWITSLAPHWRSITGENFEPSTDPAAAMASVAESILFLLRSNLDEIRAAGLIVDSLRVSGGLSRSDAICQHAADICGVPIWRPDMVETTAQGIAMLAANKLEWPIAANHDGNRFSPQQVTDWQTRYKAFVELMNSLNQRAL